jgi:hypothetical protein
MSDKHKICRGSVTRVGGSAMSGAQPLDTIMILRQRTISTAQYQGFLESLTFYRLHRSHGSPAHSETPGHRRLPCGPSHSRSLLYVSNMNCPFSVLFLTCAWCSGLRLSIQVIRKDK